MYLHSKAVPITYNFHNTLSEITHPKFPMYSKDRTTEPNWHYNTLAVKFLHNYK